MHHTLRFAKVKDNVWLHPGQDLGISFLPITIFRHPTQLFIRAFHRQARINRPARLRYRVAMADSDQVQLILIGKFVDQRRKIRRVVSASPVGMTGLSVTMRIQVFFSKRA